MSPQTKQKQLIDEYALFIKAFDQLQNVTVRSQQILKQIEQLLQERQELRNELFAQKKRGVSVGTQTSLGAMAASGFIKSVKSISNALLTEEVNSVSTSSEETMCYKSQDAVLRWQHISKIVDIKKVMVLLKHALDCPVENCFLPGCTSTKHDIIHKQKCTTGLECTMTVCSTIRKVVEHWESCEVIDTCIFCKWIPPSNYKHVIKAMEIVESNAQAQSRLPHTIHKTAQRPTSLISKSSNTECVSTNPTSKLNMKDALLYLDGVKFTFIDKPEVYNKFLDVLKDFKNQKVPITQVMRTVNQLFYGYPKLIAGFKVFLPSHYEVVAQAFNAESFSSTSGEPEATQVFQRSDEEPCNINSNLSATQVVKKNVVSSQTQTNVPIDFSQVSSYVNKVQERFRDEPEKFNCFVKILLTFRKTHEHRLSSGVKDNVMILAEKEVQKQITELFANNEDLSEEFSQRLADGPGNSDIGAEGRD